MVVFTSETGGSSGYKDIEKYLYYPEIEERKVYNVEFLKIIAVGLVIVSIIAVLGVARITPVNELCYILH
jgi:hypothetical protein